jgi:acyl-CoA thioesterase YciA
MVIDVEAWRRDRHGEEHQLVTQAAFTFVAVGEDKKPRPVDAA